MSDSAAFLRRLLLCCATLAAACGPAKASDSSTVEYALKGAYLYKFLPFVEWPASAFSAPNSPLSICLLGLDPFGPALDKTVADQHVGAHPVTVRRITTAADALACQVVFIEIGDAQTESNAVHAFIGRPVLTVTDSNEATVGIIGFAVEQNHVRFDIDDATAARSGLIISSKLLSLARNVKTREAPQ